MRFLIVLLPEDPGTVSHQSARFGLERFLESYYQLLDAGVDLVIASPEGGYPMMAFWDHNHHGPRPFTDRFMRDSLARDALSDTLRLDQIIADDFDSAYCIGATNPPKDSRAHDSIAIIARTLLQAGKMLAFAPTGMGAELSPPEEGLLLIGGGSTALGLATLALFEANSQRK